MVGCTPFLVVSYFYLWFVPPFISGRFIWYLGFYCLYQTLITVSVRACVCVDVCAFFSCVGLACAYRRSVKQEIKKG